ncbi:MAG: LD-carboxypeptidase [Clostridiales bacterium]|nr:LD-carboxypeptidase [Clostridiales bacterium]
MQYPTFLKKGGTIGFVAPSYGCNIEPYRTAFDSALETFRSMGFQVELGPNCYEGSGIGISNTPQKCAAELQKFYSKRSNDVLISCGGGELMCDDLNYLDFDKIAKAKPKWYMGYSDNTNMTFLLTTLCDTASVYGPCASAFGMEPWHASLEDAFSLLTGENLTVHGYELYEAESGKDEENPLAPYNVTEPRIMVKVPDEDVRMEGRLIGGCLDVLTLYTGTKYDRVKEFAEKYKEDGILWFLEACDLNTMGIRRALWQLEQSGWFRHVKGFLIGRPLCHGEAFLGMNQYDAVMGILEKYHVPVLMDLDIGHIPPAMPLICGSYAKVETFGNEITVEMILK